MTKVRGKVRAVRRPELNSVGAVLGGIGTLILGVVAVAQLLRAPDGAIADLSSAPASGAASVTPHATVTATPTTGPSPSVPQVPAATARAAMSEVDLAAVLGDLAVERLAGVEPAAPYGGFTRLDDDEGLISVSTPVEWADVDLDAWENDQGVLIGPAVVAARDIDGLYDRFDTAGLFIGAARNTVSPDDLLDARVEVRSARCESLGRYDLLAWGLVGRFAVWDRCDGRPTMLIDIALNPRSGEGTVNIHLRLVSDRDAEMLAVLLDAIDVDLGEVVADGGLRFPGELLP